MTEPEYVFVKGKGWVYHQPHKDDWMHPIYGAPDRTRNQYWYWTKGDYNSAWYSDAQVILPPGKYYWMYNNRGEFWQYNYRTRLFGPEDVLNVMQNRIHKNGRGWGGMSIYRFVWDRE